MSSRLNLYTIFHLNLAYSSIEEDQRSEVIDKCYWPLLNLCEDLGILMGIEASAYTLEEIARISPNWITKFSDLLRKKKCELIGSGYAQVIGPLVPAKVNINNLLIGNKAYEELLGKRPSVALVNEQAYSGGLVPHYLAAGYKAIAMEWNNPRRFHPEWKYEWHFFPQKAISPNGESIWLIWNDAIAFQKFQRYAHGEMDLAEYLAYIKNHADQEDRIFPLYGNDIEIFDFRPGRYHTEAPLREASEWEKIRILFENISSDTDLQLILPSQALVCTPSPNCGNPIYLESPEQPVPVKKQEKYNLSRWAITGRDDLGANTLCWQIYKNLINLENNFSDSAREFYWKKLCYFWSSDFRTHITEKRWENFKKEINIFKKELESAASQHDSKIEINKKTSDLKHPIKISDPNTAVKTSDKFIEIENEAVTLILNARKGLAIEALSFNSSKPLIGTLHHGYFQDISLGADFFSGHSVLEVPGDTKITDLNPVESLEVVRKSNGTLIKAKIPSEIGYALKEIFIDQDKPRIDFIYTFFWKDLLGSFRTAMVTLIPESFDINTLFYRTCNGGEPETFLLKGTNFSHGDAATTFVSARLGFGATEGWVELGDRYKSIKITIDQMIAAAFPLITFYELEDKFFFRLNWSLNEVDETRKIAGKRILGDTFSIKTSIELSIQS